MIGIALACGAVIGAYICGVSKLEKMDEQLTRQIAENEAKKVEIETLTILKTILKDQTTEEDS